MLLTNATIDKFRLSQEARQFIKRNGWMGIKLETLLSAKGDFNGIIKELSFRSKGRNIKFHFKEQELPFVPEFDIPVLAEIETRKPYFLTPKNSEHEYKVYFGLDGEVCMYEDEMNYKWTRRINANTGEIEINDGNNGMFCYQHDARGNLVTYRDLGRNSLKLKFDFNSKGALYRISDKTGDLLYVPKLDDKIVRAVKRTLPALSITAAALLVGAVLYLKPNT